MKRLISLFILHSIIHTFLTDEAEIEKKLSLDSKKSYNIYGISVDLSALFRMSFFGAAHNGGPGGAKKAPLPKIYHTYPTIMTFGSAMLYLKKIHKMYESRDTPFDFC